MQFCLVTSPNERPTSPMSRSENCSGRCSFSSIPNTFDATLAFPTAQRIRQEGCQRGREPRPKRRITLGVMTNQWNAAEYDAKHAFVYEKAKGLVELLAPKAGERILDLGCGTGALAAEIAARGAEVLGLDRSEEMIGQARKKFPALRFEVMDARELQSKLYRADRADKAVVADAAERGNAAGGRIGAGTTAKAGRIPETGFDAVFSNAVLHWFPEADEVIAGVVRALKAGGRFVAGFCG